jgi:CheY-like chemotaxis protein
MGPELSPSLRSACILVVEDEVLLRSLLADTIRETGLVVVEASNGDEAMAFLRAGGEVDLIFADVHMPGTINGLELALRVRIEYPSLPIVLTSGNIGPGDTHGLGEFVAKPYSIDHVISYLMGVLGRSRLNKGHGTSNRASC